MALSCKGICEEYKGSRMPNGARYEKGQKRCTFCSIFVVIHNVRCPCCGSILRTKARSKKP